MNKLDKTYQTLLQDIIDNGVIKQDRTGTGTISVFGRQIRHKMSEGFPLLTTKKMAWKTMVTELLWFLRGDTNIKYLVDNNCHIWDGDAFKYYTKKVNEIIDGYKCGDIIGMQDHIEKLFSDSDKLTPLTMDEFINKIKTDDEFAKKWGELGPIYGKQWRSWNTKQFESLNDGNFGYRYNDVRIDQIAILINDLKTNPDSRRLMVSAWNVGELDQMTLPPCHYGFQVYTRELNIEERLDWTKINHPNVVNENGWFDLYSNFEEAQLWFDRYDIGKVAPTRTISLSWNQRSVDVFLGLPFNIASYGLLLEMIAREVNMMPYHLIGHLGDTHLYSNHIEQAKEQISRESKDLLPTLKMSSGHNFRAALKGKVDEIDLNDFILLGYDPHPTIKAPLSN